MGSSKAKSHNTDANRVEETNLDRTCLFGHASTKHMSNSGMPIDLAEATRSNRTRTAILSSFASFLERDDQPFVRGQSLPFEAISERAHALNPRAPATLSEVFPLDVSRSFESVWHEMIGSGGPMSAFLSFAHSEACRSNPHHGGAARSVIEHLLSQFHQDLLYVTQIGRGAFSGYPSFGPTTERLDDTVIMSQEDVRCLQTYQLLQERWMNRRDLVRLNEQLNGHPSLFQLILDVQQHLTDAIGHFLKSHPEHANSKVTFGEIALWDPDMGGFVPSSRLLKAVLHNTGPWLLDAQGQSADERLLNAINGARTHGAFEQHICIFERQDHEWRLAGVERKVCPAKTSLLRLMTTTLEKG